MTRYRDKQATRARSGYTGQKGEAMKHKLLAKKDFITIIRQSWTYARLTENERTRFFQALREFPLYGTYKQRYEQLNRLYMGFLLALDYKPVGWREDEVVPLF